MARCAILPSGPGFDAPPISLRDVDPDLYDYLTAVHHVIFGTRNSPTGSLGADNLQGEFATPSAPAEPAEPSVVNIINEDALTLEQHAAIEGNPHGVSASDVGNEEAIWNASKIGNVPVRVFDPDQTPLRPNDGQVLQYDESGDSYKPQTLEPQIQVTQKLKSLPTSGSAWQRFSLPKDAVVFAVRVGVVEPAGAATQSPFGRCQIKVGYMLSTDRANEPVAPTAWGYANLADVGRSSANETEDYSITGPIYAKPGTKIALGLDHVYFEQIGGQPTGEETSLPWPGGKILVEIFYWELPRWSYQDA